MLIGLIGEDIKDELTNFVHKIFSVAGLKPSIIEINKTDGYSEHKINQYLSELQKYEVDVVVFLIDVKHIGLKLPQAIQFDIIISFNNIDLKTSNITLQQIQFTKTIYSKIKKEGILIINADDESSPKLIHGLVTHIVTYGFNTKATITASSIGDSLNGADYIFCLQRSIRNIKGLKVEPHEFSVRLLKHSRRDVYNILAIATLMLVCGVDIDHIRNLLNGK